MTVVSLTEKQKEVDQEMVDHLQQALELAKSGEITDLVLGYTQPNLEFFTIVSYRRYLQTLGLAEQLKMDVLAQGDQGE